ncbi:uncharacterized protein N7506_005619 [Penicillium brevicompactum]|uniref:uncharacterized protein n=1 Tax=Penicillium brevicompactum TaxID=5074 RepID=UPI0025408C0B|nr:uncharacterized protein N7506_005619 [Penicillium brevicompactum]KAJ5335683.1 hypothetical protein N7506_005619 [Penicillium brevicompactum]
MPCRRGTDRAKNQLEIQSVSCAAGKTLCGQMLKRKPDRWMAKGNLREQTSARPGNGSKVPTQHRTQLPVPQITQ